MARHLGILRRLRKRCTVRLRAWWLRKRGKKAPHIQSARTNLAKLYEGQFLHLLGPSECQSGEDIAKLAPRKEVYEQARARNPNRWSGQTRNWKHKGEVNLNPHRVEQVHAKIDQKRSRAFAPSCPLFRSRRSRRRRASRLSPTRSEAVANWSGSH